MDTNRQRIFGTRLTLAAILMLASLEGLAGDVKVIANPDIRADTISARELKSIFLLQRRDLSDGSSVIPVMQKSGRVHEAFLEQYLDRSSEELLIYYQGLSFTGRATMPKELNSDQEVVAYVVKTKGAIGYVSTTADTTTVKTLAVGTLAPKAERTLIKRVDPEYPATLRQMGIRGTVRLLLTVSQSGLVESTQLLGGNPILGEAAEKAARQWQYSPAPTKTKLEVTIPFGTK